MDNSEVGRIFIVMSLILTTWTFRKPLYAVYLEYGIRGFITPLITPFVVYSKFFRSLRDERNKWAEKTIREHRESK